MFEKLGSHIEAREAAKRLEPKCTILLLEAFRMRNMQVDVSLHL